MTLKAEARTQGDVDKIIKTAKVNQGDKIEITLPLNSPVFLRQAINEVSYSEIQSFLIRNNISLDIKTVVSETPIVLQYKVSTSVFGGQIRHSYWQVEANTIKACFSTLERANYSNDSLPVSEVISYVVSYIASSKAKTVRIYDLLENVPYLVRNGLLALQSPLVAKIRKTRNLNVGNVSFILGEIPDNARDLSSKLIYSPLVVKQANTGLMAKVNTNFMFLF